MSTKRNKKKPTAKKVVKKTNKEFNHEQYLLYTFDSLRKKTKKAISDHIVENQERLNVTLVKLNKFMESLSKELSTEDGKLPMKEHLVLITMLEQITETLKMSAATSYLEALKKEATEEK